jgi:hypothetical protein
MSTASPERFSGAALDRPRKPQQRRIALIAGVLFVITFISATRRGCPVRPVLEDGDYIVGAGADTRMQLGAFCEVILAIATIATIATAVTRFPMLRRQNEAIALGNVANSCR